MKYLPLLLLVPVLAWGGEKEMCIGIDPDLQHLCSSPPPPGTGLRYDGHGAIHLPKPGFYLFFNGTVNGITGRYYYKEGTYAGVVMNSSAPLEWLRPDGVREVVPKQFLYPPF